MILELAKRFLANKGIGRMVFLAFFLAFLVRLPLDVINAPLSPDEVEYLTAAVGDVARYVVFRLFLRLVFSIWNNLVFGRAIISLISSLSVFTMYQFCRQVTKDSRMAFLASLFYVFNAFHVYFSCRILTEAFYYLLVPAFMYLFYKHMETNQWRCGFMCGIVAGLALLFRYAVLSLYLVLLLACILLKREKFYKSFIVICVGIVVALSLWFVFNYTLFGNPVYPLLENVLLNVRKVILPFPYFPTFILINIFTFPFIIYAVMKEEKSQLFVTLLFWCILQHLTYFGHHSYFDLIRLNTSTLPVYVIFAAKGYGGLMKLSNALCRLALLGIIILNVGLAYGLIFMRLARYGIL